MLTIPDTSRRSDDSIQNHDDKWTDIRVIARWGNLEVYRLISRWWFWDRFDVYKLDNLCKQYLRIEPYACEPSNAESKSGPIRNGHFPNDPSL